ncbi:MAG: DsbC family protein [Deferrisomatales bacterium]|nr:DsbC family protein [Deferrisomatales bacterium]
MPLVLAALAAACLLFATHVPGALAFPETQGSSRKCTDCHNLTTQEAAELLRPLVDAVLDVRPSRLPGFWDVDVERQGQKLPVSLDYGRRFLVTGDVIDLQTMESVTRERMVDLHRVDVSRIPLDDAIVIGDPKAPVKIVVFDDPECPFCQKIHPEMKKAAAQRPEVAFFIKMFPLKMHPDAARKARSIICSGSAQMLEDSLAGRPIPDPTCETDQVEKNEALARELGISSTPTLVFPDGRVLPGYKTAERILALLDGGQRDAPHKTGR